MRLHILGFSLLLLLLTTPAWALTGFPAGNGVQIQDEGVSLAVRPTINYKGDGVVCADNGGTNAIDCTFAAGTGADVDQVGDCLSGECFMSTGTGTQQVWHGTASGTLTINAPAAAGTTTQTFQALTGLLCVQNAAFTANAFTYSGASGIMASTAAPTNGQLLIGSTGVAPAVAALTGTANQVTVTNGAGSITLAGPQDLATSSSPAFTALSLGTNPASAGELRLPNTGTIQGRALGNLQDRQMLTLDALNRTIVGSDIATTVINSNLVAPSSPQGGWSWNVCSGTSPSRVCSYNVQDGGATRVLASMMY